MRLHLDASLSTQRQFLKPTSFKFPVLPIQAAVSVRSLAHFALFARRSARAADFGHRSVHQINKLPSCGGCAGVTLSALSLLHAAAGAAQPIWQPRVPCWSPWPASNHCAGIASPCAAFVGFGAPRSPLYSRSRLSRGCSPHGLTNHDGPRPHQEARYGFQCRIKPAVRF